MSRSIGPASVPPVRAPEQSGPSGRPGGGGHEDPGPGEGAPRWVRWSVTPRDPWPLLTWAALAGLVSAAGMAALGLPPLDLHGLLHRFGVMDPLCGGTRAVRLAAMGSWSDSWRYNPVGVPLVLGASGLLLRAAVGWATGRWVAATVVWTRRRRWAAWALLALTLVALDVNQQAHATLLSTRQ